MGINLVDQIQGYLTPDIIQKTALYVGESNSATQRAMGGIVATLVAALASQASTPGGAQRLTRMLDSGKYDGSALSSVGSLLSGGATSQNAKEIVDSLFGGKTSGLADLIARFAGIRSGSAGSLLAMAVPLVMHVLGRQRASLGQSPSALAGLLGDQTSFLGSLLPAGLSSLLGWSGFTSRAPEVTTREPAREPTWEPAGLTPQRTRPSWFLPLLILGGLVLAGLLLISGWQSATTTARVPLKMTDVQLPGGVRISVPEGSFNYSLYQWLAGTADTATPKRFVFDNINFETGTTKLTADSGATVDSLVAIMKAYPGTAVRLEGHTDSTGDPAGNRQLSLDRANAVKTMMVLGGVAEGRIATAGYGPEKPVAANDTEEGRARNRRTELVVEKR